MTIDIVRDVLLWCLIINMGILLWWFLFFMFAHDWVYHCGHVILQIMHFSV